MRDGDVLILKGEEVRTLLAGRELEIMDTVRVAYETHAKAESSLPHSTFLTFPGDSKNRIIALPAYLGGELQVTGMKWVSSFPGNLAQGLDRASAVVILNSAQTGMPQAIIEASLINAKRTAASAACAAQWLHEGRDASTITIIGCGVINFEIIRFLLAVRSDVNSIVIFDLDTSRAAQFREKCRKEFPQVGVDVATDMQKSLSAASLISIATTAQRPHISDLSVLVPGATILHISLRDLSPEVILSCDNIVDDVDHVCRAQTSIHLAEQAVGNRAFIRCTIAEIMLGRAHGRRDQNQVAVFSPFGLGILDIAVGNLLCEIARKEGKGTVIGSFFPDPWSQIS